MVGYPLTSFALHKDCCAVQSTAANSTFGSSLYFSAALENSGLAFLQWPHPEIFCGALKPYVVDL